MFTFRVKFSACFSANVLTVILLLSSCSCAETSNDTKPCIVEDTTANCQNIVDFTSLEDTSITKLVVRSTELKRIDKDDLAAYENLKILDIYNSGLEEINPEAFMNLENLEELNLSGNTELKIPATGPFISSKSLTNLNLSSIPLNELTKDAFTGIPNLKVLDLTETDIEDFTSLGHLEHLTSLIISRTDELATSKLCQDLFIKQIVQKEENGNESTIHCTEKNDDQITKDNQNKTTENQTQTTDTQTETKDIQSETKDIQSEIKDNQTETKDIQSEIKDNQTETKYIQTETKDNQTEAIEIITESTEPEKISETTKLEATTVSKEPEEITTIISKDIKAEEDQEADENTQETKDKIKAKEEETTEAPISEQKSEMNIDDVMTSLTIIEPTKKSVLTTEKTVINQENANILKILEDIQPASSKNIYIQNSTEASKVPEIPRINEAEQKDTQTDDTPEIKPKKGERKNENYIVKPKNDNDSDGEVKASTSYTNNQSNGVNIVLGIILSVMVVGAIAFGYKYVKNRRTGYRQTNTTETVEDGKELQTIVAHHTDEQT